MSEVTTKLNIDTTAYTKPYKLCITLYSEEGSEYTTRGTIELGPGNHVIAVEIVVPSETIGINVPLFAYQNKSPQG